MLSQLRIRSLRARYHYWVIFCSKCIKMNNILTALFILFDRRYAHARNVMDTTWIYIEHLWNIYKKQTKNTKIQRSKTREIHLSEGTK